MIQTLPQTKQTAIFLYNIEDRLTQISAYTDTEVTWEGDKLISYVGPYDFFPTYTYDNITCKKGYHPLLGLTDFAYTNPELAGMKTNQLPVSCTNVFNGTHPEYNYTVTYEYEFNTEGYISKITEKRARGVEGDSTCSYTLTWE